VYSGVRSCPATAAKWCITWSTLPLFLRIAWNGTSAVHFFGRPPGTVLSHLRHRHSRQSRAQITYARLSPDPEGDRDASLVMPRLIMVIASAGLFRQASAE
jgi:hypothetical protein